MATIQCLFLVGMLRRLNKVVHYARANLRLPQIILPMGSFHSRPITNPLTASDGRLKKRKLFLKARKDMWDEAGKMRAEYAAIKKEVKGRQGSSSSASPTRVSSTHGSTSY